MFALFLLPCVAWSLSTPMMGAPDEPAYSVQSVALWSGQPRSDPVPQPGPTPAIEFGNGRWYRIPAIWAAGYVTPTCFAFQPSRTADCAVFEGSTDVGNVPDSFTYQPRFVHSVLVGWAGRLWPGPTGVYAMRLVSAGVVALLMSWAVRVLSLVIRPALALAGVIGAATPMAYFMAGSVNPNGIEIAAALCVWAHVLAIGRWRAGAATAPTSLFVGVAAVGAALALTRPISPMFLGLVVVVGAVAAPAGRLRQLAADRRARLAGLAVGGFAVLGFALAFADRAAGGAQAGEPLVRLSRIPTHLVEAVARFGWLDTPVSRATAAWVALVAALTIAALVVGSWRDRAALGVVVVVSGMLLVPHSLPGAGGWQGRYGLPFLVGLALMIAVIVDEPLRRLLPWLQRGLPTATTLVFGLLHLYAFTFMLHRYSSGIGGPVLQGLFNTTWQPPLGSAGEMALLGVFVLGATALVWRWASSSQRSMPAPAGARDG